MLPNSRIDAALKVLPGDIRTGAIKAIHACNSNSTRRMSSQQAKSIVQQLILSVYRSEQRRQSDKRTDPMRRKLVGARVSMIDYHRYKTAAHAQGISLYRWVCNALDAAADADDAVAAWSQKLDSLQAEA